MKRLLLIGCSDRKVKTSRPLAAMDRYDGPTYRTLRKMYRGGRRLENVDMLILSAKHGLLQAQQRIESYDQKMTLKRAEELRPHVQASLDTILKTTTAWKPDPYDEVFINLGKTYMKILEGFDWGKVEILQASGGIGMKTKQMKAWLEKLSETDCG